MEKEKLKWGIIAVAPEQAHPGAHVDAHPRDVSHTGEAVGRMRHENKANRINLGKAALTSAKGIIFSHPHARLNAAIYDYQSNVPFAGSRPPLGGLGGRAMVGDDVGR